MVPAFSHIRNWIFDLDNTLYPAAADLFGHIDRRMGSFIARLVGCGADEARTIQKRYWMDHGTTLSGLMEHHGVDPHEFLDYVHDIPMDALDPAPGLAASIAALPGRKYVFTNGDAPYAEKILDRRGLSGLFDGIHDIHACAYHPKPRDHAYASMVDAFAVDPRESLFVEDMARNLAPAKALGMTTIWVNNGSERGEDGACASYIDHEIDDLEDWFAGGMAPAGKKADKE